MRVAAADTIQEQVRRRAQNRQRFVDGALLQESKTSDGGGSTQFRLRPDGNTMIVTRISRSPKLPGVVEYGLTYARQPGTP